MLEPDALKGASPVLRGGGGSNAASLPDRLRGPEGKAKVVSSTL